MSKLRGALFATAIFLVLPALVAAAAAPPGPYFNGFETNTAGWSNYSGATVTRVASGSTGYPYADGIAGLPARLFGRIFCF